MQTLLLELNNYDEKIIIIGEAHFVKEDKDFLEKVIKEFKPNYLLHELVGEITALNRKEIKKYLDNCYERNSGPIMCEPSLNGDIFKIAYKYNIALVGIDIDDYEGKIMEGLSLKKKFLLRETRMVQKIKEYYNKGKIVVVVGDTHLRTIKTPELGDISLIQKTFGYDKNVRIIRSKNGEIK